MEAGVGSEKKERRLRVLGLEGKHRRRASRCTRESDHSTVTCGWEKKIVMEFGQREKKKGSGIVNHMRQLSGGMPNRDGTLLLLHPDEGAPQVHRYSQPRSMVGGVHVLY